MASSGIGDIPKRASINWHAAAARFLVSGRSLPLDCPLTRAVVFIAIGGFLAIGAFNSNSRIRLDGVLRSMQEQAHGGCCSQLPPWASWHFG
jgi:hypothetical protein